MARYRFALIAAAAFAVAACSDDDATGPAAASDATAFVRYVHAVADTGAMIWRPIDRLELSPPGFLGFRGFTNYQEMGVGARQIRIFPDTTAIAIASQILIDTTITFEANKFYTLIHAGYARPGQTPADRIIVFEDPIPAAPSATQIAIRAVHAGSGLSALDVFASAAGGTTPLPAAPSFRNLAFGTASAYVTLDRGPMAFRVTSSGTTTPVVIDATVTAGTAGTTTLNPVGGSTIGGSVLTAIAVPRSVVGSKATNFTTPGIIYLVDKRPPATAP